MRFGDVEIDLAGHRLRVAGREMPLEHKAFQVLVTLARQPGRVFTRDEILDAVWGHRHVTPGVLNRAITLLRQALGESGDEARCLHTVHGVGYRFDAPEPADASMQSATAQSPAPNPVVPGPGMAAAPASAVDAGAIVAASTASIAQTPAAAPTHGERSRHRPLVLAALLVAIAVAAVAALLARRDAAPVAQATAPTLVVLPLRPVGSAHDESVLADGLSEELITRLAHASGLRVISSTSARLAQTQNLDAAQLAQRLGGTHALEGSLRQIGTALRIDLRLIDLPAGRTLWAHAYDREVADALTLERDIAQSVAASLALQLRRDAADPVVDPDAFREYLDVRQTMREAQTADVQAQARQRLRALVARVPTFARAHGLLARLLAGFEAGIPRSREELEEAQREATRAIELDPHQTEAYIARGMLAGRTQDWATCLGEIGRALELDPTDTTSRTYHAAWLANLGYLDAALSESAAAIAADPLDFNPHVVHGRILDTIGRHADAERVLAAAARLGSSGQERTVYARWFNAVWRGDFAAARTIAQSMPAELGYRESSLLVLDALVDPARTAQAHDAIEKSERLAGRPNFARALLADAVAEAPTVFDAFENPLRQLTSSYSMLPWNTEYAALRSTPAFQDYLRRNRILDYWRAHGFPPQCRAEGDGAACS